MPANSFLGIFAQSPFKPLERHIDIVDSCCQVLQPFFKAVFSESWSDAETHLARMEELEKQANAIQHGLRLNLPSGIFMPINREDLLALLSSQHRMARVARKLAAQVLDRQLTFPSESKDGFLALLSRSLDATQQARKVINELDELLETGFKGREADLVESMIVELDQIENDTTQLHQQLRRAIWAKEQDLNPVDAMFLYKTLDGVTELADVAQHVGDRLELTLAG